MKTGKRRTFLVTPSVKAQLMNLTITASSAVCQSLVNANDDDSLLIKAMRRRLALPPIKENFEARMSISQDVRIDAFIEELAARTQLSQEQVIRLSIEAFIYKL